MSGVVSGSGRRRPARRLGPAGVSAPDVVARLLTPAVAALDALWGQLSVLAQEAAALWSGGPPAGDALATLRPTIKEVLLDEADLAAGAGVAAGPEDLAHGDRRLEWWWTRPTGGAEALRVNLDPSAPDGYDFTAEAWFTQTVADAVPVVAGPVVDYACTGDYALTVTHPVTAHGRVVAVAAADVPIARLEARAMPLLTEGGRARVVVNAVGRVVLSSAPWLPPGARVTPDAAAHGWPLPHPALAGWHLLEPPPPPT